MSVSFITGRPGNGKGLVSVDVIRKELVEGDRCIITNLPVRIAPWVRSYKRSGKRVSVPELGFRAFLMREYGKDFDIEKRLFVLPDERVGEFFLFRVVNGVLEEAPCERDDKGRIISFDTTLALSSGGVVYLTDEAWRNFGARDWANTGKGVLFYGAQHRHLGDDWFIVTQHTKQVDTAFRQIAQDYWVVTNHSKRRIGIFRQPDLFSVGVFGVPPEGKAEEPMFRRVFRLDKKGIGGCYDTTGGVGISGGGSADIHEKKRGLHILWVILFLVLGGGLIIGTAKGMGYFAGKVLTPNGPSAGASAPVGRVVASSPKSWGIIPAPGRFFSGSSSAPPVSSSVKVVRSAVHVTGICGLGGDRYVVTLSDGRMLRTDRGELQQVGRDWCRDFSGRIYRVDYAEKTSE